jgi:SMC interacting uncharacterized protein involved in chromosome segregation
LLDIPLSVVVLVVLVVVVVAAVLRCQFLYGKIDPKFEFAALPTATSRRSVAGRQEGAKGTANAQQQVPMLLAQLGYPIKLNKSAFISCGSRSNWPKMLGALQFLLEIATLQETVDVNEYIFAEDVVAGADGLADESSTANALQNEQNFEYLYVARWQFLPFARRKRSI